MFELIIYDCDIILPVPNEKRMYKKAGRIIEEFKDLVFPEAYVPGVKRRVGKETQIRFGDFKILKREPLV